MKLLTITVPCYNSEGYMRKCIDSLLPGGEDVEILIVDDGSTDQTAAIADEYAEKYPDIVKVIPKENGGHGSGVNTQPACFSRWWTVMTGCWTQRIRRFLIPFGCLRAAMRCWIC